jgi:hypothetical protein
MKKQYNYKKANIDNNIKEVFNEQMRYFIGNPIFAIQTNLDPLRKRIRENRIEESLQIIDEIEQSISKINEVLSDGLY